MTPNPLIRMQNQPITQTLNLEPSKLEKLGRTAWLVAALTATTVLTSCLPLARGLDNGTVGRASASVNVELP